MLVTCLLILFKLAEIQFIKGDIRLEVIVALTSLIFFGIGVWFNRKKSNPSPKINNTDSGLTKREIEVLLKMSEGLSNQEIATSLYLSESTIKTHVSNILFKLDAKRRTEAVKLARDKGLIP
jgi:DNA-binding NarL/FixJ family response regulator